MGRLGIIWILHGALVALIAALCAPLLRQTYGQAWMETMEMLGWWSLVEPVRGLLSSVVAARVSLFCVAALALATGIFALARAHQARWPLQLCAAMHLILVPYGAWIFWPHLPVELTSTAMTVANVLMIMLTEACLVGVMVWTAKQPAERPRSWQGLDDR